MLLWVMNLGYAAGVVVTPPIPPTPIPPFVGGGGGGGLIYEKDYNIYKRELEKKAKEKRKRLLEIDDDEVLAILKMWAKIKNE